MPINSFPIPTQQVSVIIGNLLSAANEAAALAALGAAPTVSPVFTGAPEIDANSDGLAISSNGNQVANLDEIGVQLRRPLIMVPRDIGDGDSSTVNLTDLVVTYSRTDSAPLVFPDPGSASGGQWLIVTNNSSSPVVLDGSVAGSFFDGDSGIVNTITLAASETITFQALIAQWRVTSRYVSDVEAALALKQNLVLTLNTMGASDNMVAAPGTLNVKASAGNVILTQSGLLAQGVYWLNFQNTAITPITVTLPTAGGVSFYSDGLGAPRLTFVIAGSSTKLIRFTPVTPTTISMESEPIQLSLYGSASPLSLTADLIPAEQSGILKKATPAAILQAGGFTYPDGQTPAVLNGYLAVGDATNPGTGSFLYVSWPGPTTGAGEDANLEIQIAPGANKTLNFSRGDKFLQNIAIQDSDVNFTATTTFITIGSDVLLAGQVAAFEYVLHLNLSAVGSGKLRIVATGTTSFLIWEVIVVNNGAGVVQSERQTASGSVTSITAGPTSVCVKISGSIQCTTDVTLALEFAQLVASGTSSVLAGSSHLTAVQ